MLEASDVEKAMTSGSVWVLELDSTLSLPLLVGSSSDDVY
jgi:hypothetical protein